MPHGKRLKKTVSEVNNANASSSASDSDELGFDLLSKKNMSKMIKLMTTMKGLEESLERQEEFLIEKIEELKALNVKYEELQESHSSLSNLYGDLKVKHIFLINKLDDMPPVNFEMPCTNCNILSKDKSTISPIDDVCATKGLFISAGDSEKQLIEAGL